ncbi:uncharacterized protein BDR25DRAFT_357206 [Lindgomyces ingoldianus]|uniref:Uncharacterized protein n=1 Tax=Lindgomyces ingoldianus TaxID=673940 RepID=A0ACB6QP99_9PLEO|nr:uncharacterized protein BDR25DRAFT_357206 [Lindgomyces ingoldianus]KAF2468839.1 hypothetical protein BDR25DRAFT_357206 [Lindgomyces ingoldianus]
MSLQAMISSSFSLHSSLKHSPPDHLTNGPSFLTPTAYPNGPNAHTPCLSRQSDILRWISSTTHNGQPQNTTRVDSGGIVEVRFSLDEEAHMASIFICPVLVLWPEQWLESANAKDVVCQVATRSTIHTVAVVIPGATRNDSRQPAKKTALEGHSTNLLTQTHPSTNDAINEYRRLSSI